MVGMVNQKIDHSCMKLYLNNNPSYRDEQDDFERFDFLYPYFYQFLLHIYRLLLISLFSEFLIPINCFIHIFINSISNFISKIILSILFCRFFKFRFHAFYHNLFWLFFHNIQNTIKCFFIIFICFRFQEN